MKNYDDYVLQIMAAGSLTKAAEVLGISQPALSLGLNKLEKELGFKIFNRRTMPLRFTSEGKVYYDYILRARLLHEDFALRISVLREEFNHKVVVGAPEVYIGGIVTSAIKQLLTIHPDFSVGLKSASMSQLMDLAANREIDCFISTTDHLPANFEQMPVMEEKIYLCIPKKNPLNKKLTISRIKEGTGSARIDFACLSGEKFVYLEEWQPMQKKLRSFFKLYGIEPVNQIVVNQVSTLLNMAIASEGLCIAAENALACNGNAEQFCLYLLPETLSDRLIYIAYDKDLYLPEAAQEFIKLLTKTGGDTK